MRAIFTLKTTATRLSAAEPAARRVGERRKAPRWAIAASLGFLTLSLSGNMLINAELKGLYHFIFTYLTLPIIALCYGIGWFGMPRWRQSVSLLKASTAPALVGVVILFTCSGAVNYVNALLGGGNPVQFSGAITRLSHTSGKSGSGYYVVILDSATGQRREFRITKREYTALEVGSTYSRGMKQGGLGYAYEWRH